MRKTPKGLRLHIGIFGRRNVGKSSLLNAITKQETAIVSPVAGTTTDPVEKTMELHPFGPVVFIDTAGIDDEGDLGNQRIQRSLRAIRRTELALLVTDEWTDFEARIFTQLRKKEGLPVIVVVNKADLRDPAPTVEAAKNAGADPVMVVSALNRTGIAQLHQKIVELAPESNLQSPTILADLVPPGGLAVLVVPIDKEAPKGRLILPQVQTIRDLLDNDAMALVVKERELAPALRRLNQPPDIVVTDSQAFLKVAADTPPEIPMTSFSILFARLKGELNTFVRGALAIEDLEMNDKVLIAESCTHHPIADDIGRVKIPRWLEQYTGMKLQFDIAAGHDFPDDITQYKLIIHCGGCMTNRRQILSRLAAAGDAGVPITNYGLAIAYTLGIFPRALQPFPGALEILKQHQQ
ncbi:MAG: [FeFe] hydrogenase H-cluster maturation GTPase HydF [Lentisphaerae bacterium]|nr:MAG: [FeFe] hydrogenase H-cluster maturation GTPase HydF [Lentisphaerota bacterium]